MKNTTFRRRALLSSVAMLLVALVALGSATFAWFSTTSHAEASTINAKTAKASAILVSETGNSGWTNDLTFALNTSTNTNNLTPVTTKDFENWYSVQADGYDLGYSDDAYGTAISNITTSGSYAKYTQLFIQAQNVGKTLKLTCTATDADATGIDYLRVALVPIASTPSTATFATGEAGKEAIIFANGDNDRSNATAGWTTSGQTKDSIVNGTFGTQLTLGAATADKIYGFDVYVYYEGTDFDCKDSKSGTDVSVEFAIDGV